MKVWKSYFFISLHFRVTVPKPKLWDLRAISGGIFKLLRSPKIDSASLCSLAGRYDTPIPTRFLTARDYLEYHRVCPLVVIGTPPLTQASEPSSRNPLERGLRGHTRLRVREWESPNLDDWRESSVLCKLCDLNTWQSQTPIVDNMSFFKEMSKHRLWEDVPGFLVDELALAAKRMIRILVDELQIVKQHCYKKKIT